ncbi:uncharacterized protein BO97DRAFT_401728 [Aspergillus homomorphus CBS 101889]|uniref:Uncharacterized protein n=1 Tax=Aspergillus homomorphus (strain CBS 101889) TaxID=1450537 RepID=A0A395HGI2_ASPHC|nr:hypothetical protein BO97DRAFT_401728 [Aspergillus homomorphus CBS 101889]RAL06583.1 hypothetical protein BO97DRAFT_401728 [Aspergillus homomorphus CBS 101889]
MSLNTVRSISSTTKRSILNLLGRVTEEDVRKTNGSSGSQWVSSLQKLKDDVESQYDSVTGYEIQGAKAHKSSKDPADPEDVITIGFYSQNGTRLLSGHVHENGTYKLAESRAGKGKGKGQGSK